MTRFHRSLQMFSAALLVFVAVAADAAPHAIPIALARHLPAGTVVTVQGPATTPSGAFESSFFDKGFAIQDLTGGIYVSLQTDLGVTVRRQVRVTGTLQDNGYGLLLLVPASPSDVQLQGTGRKVLPLWLPTGVVGEATEGRLVRSIGVLTRLEGDQPYGEKFFINDGSGELTIFVNNQTGIDLSGLAVGQIVSVTGMSSQFDTHYEIDPRFPADVVVLH